MKNNEITAFSCCHSLRIGSLCAVCGTEIVDKDELVPALHSTDRLVLTQNEAQALHKTRNEKLEKCKKMILILDLDQTLLHSTFQESYCDFTFTLFLTKFYVKLRPFLKKFLKKMAKLFEMHIYTMGTRDYADEICKKIDPTGKFFGDRIVTRCENFNEMKKSIDRITSIHSNVVILDDRADVWDYTPNLVLIKPFYFNDDVDINDPSKKPLYIPNNSKSSGIIVSIPEKADQSIERTSKFLKNDSNDLSKLNGSDNSENPLKLILKIDPEKFNEKSSNSNEESQPINYDSKSSDLTDSDLSHRPIGQTTDANVQCGSMRNIESLNSESSDLSAESQSHSTNIIEIIPNNSSGCERSITHFDTSEIPESSNKISDCNAMDTDNQNNLLSTLPLNQVSRSRLMDSELLKVIKILTKMHQRYFKKNKNTSELLKIKSLKRLRIASGSENFNLILFSGATLDLDNPSLVIDNWQLAEKFKVLNVQVEWLYKCIYKRKAVATLPFLISDHRPKCLTDTDNHEFFVS